MKSITALQLFVPRMIKDHRTNYSGLGYTTFGFVPKRLLLEYIFAVIVLYPQPHMLSTAGYAAEFDTSKEACKIPPVVA